VAGEPWAVLVVSGIVRLYLGTDGVEPTLLHGTHGALLGTHWVPTDESFAVGLQSVTPATLLQLPSLRVPELLASDPGFATAVRDEGQAQLHELIGSFAARTGLSLPERLAREILVLADLQPDQVLVPVTEQQLADAIGSIRESIGRTIADFRRDGWLATTRHGVIVLDRAALSRLARLND
jgi:CRP-like cAMP-binding protein